MFADNGNTNNSGSGSTPATTNNVTTLDLSSTSATISASQFSGSNLSISTSSGSQVISGTGSLTAAQFVAALQVQAGGPAAQTLQVSSAGNATGGTFVLPTSLASHLTSLNVPTGVSAIYDFGAGSNLNLSGNLVNSGNIFAISTNHSVTSGIFSALNIVNGQGAMLTSVLPQGGLTGFTNLVSSLSLTLNAINSITNYGTISSSGALTMTAGNSIVNASIANNLAATISAVNNVNMMAANISNQGQITSALHDILIQTANMTNSGLIQAMKGGIEIKNLIQNTLSITNVGGMISAGHNLDFINTVRGGEIDVSGGTLLADQIGFSVKRGIVHASLQDISSDVSIAAKTVTLNVWGGTHGINVTGLNKANSVGFTYLGSGDISSTGFKTRGQDVSLVTTNGSVSISGNITTTPTSGNGGNVYVSATGGMSLKNIDTRGAKTGNGGNIVLFAGEDVTANALNSSSGSRGGNPGLIRISAGLSGHGDVSLTSARAAKAGGLISISAADSITVKGALSAPSGQVLLSAHQTKVDEVDVGSGEIDIIPTNTTGSFVLDYSQLAAFGQANVVIGSSGNVNADIVIRNDCNNCLHNLDSLEINTNGSFTATGTTLTLNPDTAFVVNAGTGIYTGSVQGGSLISFVTGGSLVVDGSLHTSDGGSVVLGGANISVPGSVNSNGGDVTLVPGSGSTSISGTSLSHITTNSLTIGTGLSGQGITLTGTADLSQLTSFDVNLGGTFSAAGSSLNFDQATPVNIIAGNIISGSISGSNQVTLDTAGALTVSGTISNSTTTGSVTLSGSNISIPGAIISNTVQILPGNVAATINAGGLANITANELSIGNGTGSSNVTLTGSGVLSNVANFEVNLGGSFDGSNSHLVFNADTPVSITAANLTAGDISGTNSVALNATWNLTVAGNLDSQQVSLAGGTIAIPGTVNASTVDITPVASNTFVHASGLGNIVADQVNIGNGQGVNNVAIAGNGNLSGIGQLTIDLGNGNFNGADSNLTFNDAKVLISAANITTGDMRGADQINLRTNGSLLVAGQIQASEVLLSGASLGITGGIAGDTVTIQATTSDTKISASALGRITAETLNIGSADSPNSITLAGDANVDLSGISSALNINTGGNFNSAGTSLHLAEGSAVNITAGNINTGAISGATTVALNASNQLTVSSGISTRDGNISLSGSQISIGAPVDAGAAKVILLPGSGNLSLEAGQLGNITGGSLQIGNGQPGHSVTITGTGALTGISGNVNVDLSGSSFDSSHGSLSFNSTSNLSITAGSASTGSLNNARNVNLTTTGALTVSGEINASGAVTIAGATSNDGSAVRLEPVNVNARSFSASSGAELNSSANITVIESINMQSAGAIAINDGSALKAGADVNLNAVGTVRLGSNGGSGALVSAGQVNLQTDPFSLTRPVSADSITTSGSVHVDTYQNGKGTGDIILGSNTSISAAGTGSHPGEIGLLSATDINIGSNSSIIAVGGDLWLSAGDDIQVDHGTRLSSVAVSNVESVRQGAPLPAYTGGRIGVLAGAPQTNMGALLNSMANSRSAVNSISLPAGGWGTSNLINATGGSTLQVVFPAASPKSVDDSTFMLSGGVVYLDPPDPSNSVNFSGVTITAVAPRIIADTPILQPGGGTVPTTGNTNSGGTGTNILPPGSILSTTFGSSLAGTASSVSSSDLTTTSSRRESLSFAGFSGLSLNGPTAFPSDTLENENPKKQNNMRQAVFCSPPIVLKPKDRVDDDSWIVASSSCQPFTFEAHDGSLIVGSGPAKFAPAADRTLLLKEGKILVMTVDKIHIVKTPVCTATIPVNTAVIVEFQPDGAAFVTNLAGGKASVTLCKNDETCILSAAPGEQLLLADAECPDEKIQGLSYAGVPHERVNNWHVELSGLRGRKMSFDRQELALQEWLLSCSNRCVNQAQLRRIQQLMQSLSSATTATPTLKSMAPVKKKGLISNMAPAAPDRGDSEYSPVSYVTGSMAAPVSINRLGAPTATIRYTGKSSVGMEASGVLNFTEGEIMVTANQRTLVKAGPALIHFAPGAVAVMSLRNGMLKVRNVYEKGGTGVKACLPGRKCIGLQAGQEIILGPKGLSLSKGLSDEPVGRRRVTSLDLPSGHTFICSEISLSSFMQNSPILSQVMRSGNPADRAVAEKIMKMAVCLSVVTSSHGNYSITSQ